MVVQDEIVISGMSGRYPECQSVEEFKDALFSGKDLVTSDGRRFPPGLMDTPTRAGKIDGLEFFDVEFFGLDPIDADYTDPRHKMLMETVFECLVDAGVNPKEIRGSKTGVYCGMSSFDNTAVARSNLGSNGFTVIGLKPHFGPNATSFAFDFKGPTYSVDTACSSGMYAFVQAIDALNSGKCDYAIATAAHVCIHPYDTAEFHKLNMLATDGKSKVFNDVRDGYVRSEAIVSFFLQKKKDAKRVYASIVGAKSNCDGFKKDGITYPSSKVQTALMKDVIVQSKINPLDVTYVEAHGTGTTVGDVQECQSIVNVFCENRKEPLLVGGVKSNMGHSEVTSGLCSLTKVLISMECGSIPANLNFNKPGPDIPGINDGKLKPIIKNMPWNGGIAVINSFGFGGANATIILKSHDKVKVKSSEKASQRLVQVSGRTEAAVNFFLDNIEKHQNDQEFLALVDQVHKINVDRHYFRGYAILGGKPTREVQACASEKRPIWFVYSGIGAEWPGMGRDLMRFDVFKNTIQRCAKALKPHNIDLEDLIVNGTKESFENVINCTSAIAAIEIALTDLLASFGIKPDGFAGHSLGEVGCAYANGELEPEQAALLGFSTGYASLNGNLPKGRMADIAMDKEECQKLLPPNVFIACFNGKTSVTISGPEEEVTKFVAQQSAKGVVATLINSSNFAFHSKHTQKGGPVIIDFIRKVLKDAPKCRSPKWISTSLVESQWDLSVAKYNSPEYHQNNFLSPVYFDQVYKFIPDNAIVVEVAPQGLLQAILKKELPTAVTNISLVDSKSKDNYEFLLTAIGKIYNSGGQPNLTNLYNSVTFPVSKGTPMLSHMIQWDHSKTYFVPLYKRKDCIGEVVSVNVSAKKYSYLQGNTIDGQIMMPPTGFIVLLWETLAKMLLKPVTEVPVTFENVKIQRNVVLQPDVNTNFLVNIMKLSGNFEIIEDGSIIITGKITIPKEDFAGFFNPKIPKVAKDTTSLKMSCDDVYKELNLRNYAYKGLFRAIEESDVQGVHGKLKWENNWTSFLNGMTQLTLLSATDRGLYIPVGFQKIVIDPKEHFLKIDKETETIQTFYTKNLNIVKSGGVEIIGMDVTKVPHRQKILEEPILEFYQFVPFECKFEQDFEISVKIALGIVLENKDELEELKICNVASMDRDNSMQVLIEKILSKEPLGSFKFSGFGNKCDVLIFNEATIKKVGNVVSENLRENGFILYCGSYNMVRSMGLPIVYRQVTETYGLYLLRNIGNTASKPSTVFVKSNNFNWIEQLKKHLKTKQPGLTYLVSQEENSGIAGFMKCLSKETNGNTVKCVIVEDKNIEEFSIDSVFYKRQLAKNLSINVFKNNTWGTYRHLSLPKLESREKNFACVDILTTGDFSSLKWIERPNFESEKSKLCSVYYAGLNSKDVLMAKGKLQSVGNPNGKNSCLGMEFSGISSDGKKIMGITKTSTLSLKLENSKNDFLWAVPESWTLEEAATVPVDYAMSYYSLIIRGQLKPRESLLIHSATEALGLASIYIALSMGCTVFCTVNSEEKKHYLKQTFPLLNETNICPSQKSTKFESMIKENTKGQGVDVVVNSLSADLFQTSLRCFSFHGRFVEMGKTDAFYHTLVNCKVFLKNLSFHGVSLNDLHDIHPDDKVTLKKLLQDGLDKGVVRPLPRIVFKETEVEGAFRYLATETPKSKVLVQIRDENKDKSKELQREVLALPRVYLDPKKVYVIIGGLGGFGLELADWLIQRGATKIVLNSRRNLSNGYQSYCVNKWANWKVTVTLNTDDTSTLNGAESLILKAKEIGVVGGVFHLALALKDALFQNQTAENYLEVFKSKITSGANLDVTTRKHCPNLDYFVVFSSIACGRGNPGQSNYAMANSALEGLCEKRKQDKLHGLAIQWGPIGDVGYLANNGKEVETVFGVVPQKIRSCLRALDRLILQPFAVVASTLLNNNSEDER